MLPGIDLRLQNVLKALQQVVLPAIPVQQRLARDQALLVIGHIQIIADQWHHAARFENGSLRRLAGLGQALLGETSLGLDPEQAETLATLLTDVDTVDPADLIRSERLIVELGTVIDGVITSAGRPGPLPAALLKAVLDYGDLQAHRERVWFAANKLDPDVGDLEDIPTMLAADGRPQ